MLRFAMGETACAMGLMYVGIEEDNEMDTEKCIPLVDRTVSNLAKVSKSA